MNRREAIAALMALPATATISAAHVEQHDVLVLECEELLSEVSLARLQEVIGNVWPGRKCVVLSRGMKLKIVRDSI